MLPQDGDSEVHEHAGNQKKKKKKNGRSQMQGWKKKESRCTWQSVNTTGRENPPGSSQEHKKKSRCTRQLPRAQEEE